MAAVGYLLLLLVILAVDLLVLAWLAPAAGFSAPTLLSLLLAPAVGSVPAVALVVHYAGARQPTHSQRPLTCSGIAVTVVLAGVGLRLLTDVLLGRTGRWIGLTAIPVAGDCGLLAAEALAAGTFAESTETVPERRDAILSCPAAGQARQTAADGQSGARSPTVGRGAAARQSASGGGAG